MFTFESVKKNVIAMEYKLVSLQSLILLIPGVSLIAKKIHEAHLFDLIKKNHPTSSKMAALLGSREYNKLDTIYKGHAIGSTIQLVALVALSLFMHPFFLLFAAFAAYEFYSSFRGLTNTVTYLKEKLHLG